MTQEERVKKIVKFLDKHPEGLTQEDIAEKTEVSRMTARSDLDIARWKHDVVKRKVGSATLYYTKHHGRNVKPDG